MDGWMDGVERTKQVAARTEAAADVCQLFFPVSVAAAGSMFTLERKRSEVRDEEKL